MNPILRAILNSYVKNNYENNFFYDTRFHDKQAKQFLSLNQKSYLMYFTHLLHFLIRNRLLMLNDAQFLELLFTIELTTARRGGALKA